MKDATASRNVYLRTILRLSNCKAKIRNIDIAKELGYSRPSVTNALKKLSGDGFVILSESNGITLTPIGKEIAEESEWRCNILIEHFMRIGVPEFESKENAFRIEHLVTNELIRAIENALS